MSDEQLRLLVQFFKVMADESRLKIIGLLSTGERSVGELAELLGLQEPTVSHHLGRLRELNLVEMRAEGNTRYYWLNRRRRRRSVPMRRPGPSTGRPDAGETAVSARRPKSRKAWIWME